MPHKCRTVDIPVANERNAKHASRVSFFVHLFIFVYLTYKYICVFNIHEANFFFFFWSVSPVKSHPSIAIPQSLRYPSAGNPT